MMPCLASMSAWALDAAMSWRYRCRSKSIEAFISSMMAPGPDENRPPHILLHGISTKPLMTETQSRFAKKHLAMVLAGGIAGVVVGLAGVYGVSTLTRNVGGDAACRPAVELATKIAPFAHGEVAAVNVAKSPLRVPDLAFQDSTGKPLT